METDSENGPRGRPRVFDERVLNQIGRGPAKSRRQRQNRVYAGLAHHIINEASKNGETRWDWLLTEPRKVGILGELGRIRRERGEIAFWQVANWLVEEKPKSKEAVLKLRRLRTGKRTPGSVRELHYEILKAIQDYRLRHPDTTQLQIEAALESALRAILSVPPRHS